jgi:hypothetical protein
MTSRPASRTLVVALGAALLSAGALAPAAGAVTRTFAFTGAEQTFKVPKGVKKLRVTAIGAPGGRGITQGTAPGGVGGFGGLVIADLIVRPGKTLYIRVGGPGATGSVGVPGAAGFNGGGAGGGTTSDPAAARGGAGGGGATDIRTQPGRLTSSLGSRLIVAAGGGGGGNAHQPFPGAPGGGAGLNGGTVSGGDGGFAGSASGAGAGGSGINGGPDGAAGTFGVGGVGGETVGSGTGGGGGGGGVFGGGGGSGGNGAQSPSGGGGGGANGLGFGARNAIIGLDSTGAPSLAINFKKCKKGKCAKGKRKKK